MSKQESYNNFVCFSIYFDKKHIEFCRNRYICHLLKTSGIILPPPSIMFSEKKDVFVILYKQFEKCSNLLSLSYISQTIDIEY